MARSAKSGLVAPATQDQPASHGRARADARRRSPVVEHASAAERAAIGKAARQRMPLGSHAELAAAGRSDPIEPLEAQASPGYPSSYPSVTGG
jgi:hypothetical protein